MAVRFNSDSYKSLSCAVREIKNAKVKNVRKERSVNKAINVPDKVPSSNPTILPSSVFFGLKMFNLYLPNFFP